jgi:hypothetical protein
MLLVACLGCGGGAALPAGDGGLQDGADGGGQAGGCRQIACVTDVTSTCVPAGACVSERGVDGAGRPLERVCHANGIKMTSVTTVGTSAVTVASTVYKADGTVCYVLETTAALGPEPTSTSTVKAADGRTLGTIAVKGTSITFQCAGGAPASVDFAACAREAGMFGSPAMCTPGTCR